MGGGQCVCVWVIKDRGWSHRVPGGGVQCVNVESDLGARVGVIGPRGVGLGLDLGLGLGLRLGFCLGLGLGLHFYRIRH